MMRKIKVAFFTEVLTRDYDGAARTIYQIIDRIDRDRFEFVFFSGVQPADDFIDEVYYVEPLTIPFNKDYTIATTWGKRKAITQKLDDLAPDVVHISTPSFLGHFALSYATERQIPVTSIYHTHFISYVQYYTKGIPLVTSGLESLATRLTKNFYKKCTRVFLPTEGMRKDLVELGLRADNMAIWPRGIRLDLFNPSRRVADYWQSITKNDKKNVVFVSRLVWEKNLGTLINIGRLIAERDLPYNLIIVGDGVAREEMEQKLPMAHYMGNKSHEELSKIYASADYFVFTSISETFGNVITEAMASGLPCIIANGGGSRSLVEDGVTGYRCSPNDAEDYLDKIILLESNPQKREEIIAEALERVQRLSWDSLVASLLDQMAELVPADKLS